MVHLLLNADLFDVKGLVSSPYGLGRRTHILEVMDRYDAATSPLYSRTLRVRSYAPVAPHVQLPRASTPRTPRCSGLTLSEGRFVGLSRSPQGGFVGLHE